MNGCWSSEIHGIEGTQKSSEVAMNVNITPRQANAVSWGRRDEMAPRINMIVEIHRVIVVVRPILPAVIMMATQVPILAVVLSVELL